MSSVPVDKTEISIRSAFLLALMVVVVLDFTIVAQLDHWVYRWPGRTWPYIAPVWLSLPRFVYYFSVGAAVGKLLKFNISAALIFLAVILIYFYFLRLGTYYLYGGIYSYLIAYLPVACVPGGFLLGFFIARRYSPKR